MTAETFVLLSVSMAFIIAGIALKVSAETGQMVLIEHLKEDWTYRLPFRLRNNRYRGLSRPSYQLLAILYYIFKAVVILTLCAYYYILAGVCVVIKWIWRKIRHLQNADTANDEPEDDALLADDLDVMRDNMDDIYTNESVVNSLWNHGSEVAWHEALDYYYESLKDDEQALDCYMEDIAADEIAQLPVSAFYDFLYDKYFVWKYTAKNRLATTRKSLARYVDENRISELADIQKRLFSADRSNIEKCLSIASEIHGLGPAGASGLLSILFPENFGTIDQYVVKALKKVKGIPCAAELAKMNPNSLSIKDGVLLIRIMREQAAKLNRQFDTDFWTPRKIDMVFWSIGRVRK